MSDLYPDFIQKIRIAARHFLANAERTVGVLSHHDSDGVCSAAILFEALTRAGYKPKISFVRRMDKNPIGAVKRKNYKTWIFADYGCKEVNQYSEAMPNRFFYVLDHHKDPVVAEHGINVNPNDFGADGGSEVSGSVMCFLFACELGENSDLAGLALAGAIGDMQRKNGYFVSMNAEVEKTAMREQIVSKMGDSLILPHFPIAELSDARDLSAFLNSCSSVNLDDSLKVALGDRDAFVKQKAKVEAHVKIIDNAVNYYYNNESNSKVVKKQGKAIFFFVQGVIKSDIAGTVCTILSRRLNDIGKAIFIFSEATEGRIKVSSRIVKENVDNVDLNKIMKLAANLGGSGGGHVMASGGWVPKNKLAKFLDEARKAL